MPAGAVRGFVEALAEVSVEDEAGAEAAVEAGSVIDGRLIQVSD